jgi:hypothetical protein
MGPAESLLHSKSTFKEIDTVTSRKNWIIAAFITIASVLTTVCARAQNAPPCFDLASLQGNYTVIATYGADVAIGLAKRYVDGKGNLTGTFIVNEPLAGSTTGQRNVVSGTQAGTYTVNCDGTGVITRILTVGITQTLQFDDFVVTRAIIEDGHLIATSIADAQQTPSTIVAGGIFVTRVWTRSPSQWSHKD